MTQTLIEQLEALPRYEQVFYEDDADLEKSNDGAWILRSDLRAIIEQHNPNGSEPFGWLLADGARVLFYKNKFPEATFSDGFIEKHKADLIAIYRSSQPAIVAELVKALEDDAYAASFQSMAGYRTALIAKVKGVIG